MDKIKKYQNYIEEVFRKKQTFPTTEFPSIQDVLVIDKARKQFIQITMGWKGYEYIHHVTFHIELKDDGKVWIHENRTDKSWNLKKRHYCWND